MTQIVMAWPRKSPPLDNPYVNLLHDSVSEFGDVTYIDFGWKDAILKKYDVLHMHWPDWTLRDSGLVKSLIKLGLLWCVLLRAKVLNTSVVWTVHNLRPHDFHGPRREKILYRMLAYFVDEQIHLSAATSVEMKKEGHLAARGQFTVIPHGLYPAPSGGELARKTRISEPTRVSFLGNVSPYKGVVQLVETVANLDFPIHLVIAGQPSSAAYEAEITSSSFGVASVDLAFGRLTEEEYFRRLLDTDLAVYPFVGGLNSGAVIKALGAGVPVFVPKTPVFEALALYFPGHWIQMYEGQINVRTLATALQALKNAHLPPPNLDDLRWPAIADATRRLYAETQHNQGRPKRKRTPVNVKKG
jgi:beta-1,4-mannosyltransferase